MINFKTVELSDPKWENTGLRFITVKSSCLKGRGDICVYIPPSLKTTKEIPLVILLHGVYGSSWSWAFSGGAHELARTMIENGEMRPMVIAMPSDGLWGDGSGYVPHDGKNFEKWIAEEVPEAVLRSLPPGASFSKMFIGGLSMGGFGALKIGVKYSDRFSAVSAHSSLTNLEQMGQFVEEDITSYKQNDPSETDILQTILQQVQLPALRFDCGNYDALIGENRQLHEQLLYNNIPHQYEESDGGHDWGYWHRQLKESFRFFDCLL